ASDQIKPRFRICFLHFRKRPHYHIHAVITGEPPRAYQVRSKRVTSPIAELGKVDQIRDSDGFQSEFAEDVDEIAGGRDDFVDPRQDELSGAEASQVVASFAAPIVNDALLAAQFCEEPGGRGREQERPIGSGKNM